MAGLASLPPHVQTAIKAIQYAIDHLDPKKKAKAIEELKASREFLLGSVGLKEKLYDLNQHILDLGKEAIKLQIDEDRFLVLWEQERDIQMEKMMQGDKDLLMTLAKARAKRHEKVTEAHERYLKKRAERKDKELEVTHAKFRWYDLHQQEGQTYENQVRETLST